MGPDPRNDSGYYLVIQQAEVVAAYNSIYYRSLSEVTLDILDRIESGQVAGPWGEDFAVWRAGRVMAVLHQKMDKAVRNIVRFDEPRNDPGPARHRLLPGWPTREQWVESGKGPLWFDRHNPANPANQGGVIEGQGSEGCRGGIGD